MKSSLVNPFCCENEVPDGDWVGLPIITRYLNILVISIDSMNLFDDVRDVVASCWFIKSTILHYGCTFV